MTNAWGYHLILDCAGCNSSVSDQEQIRLFLTSIIASIGMTAVGEPVITHLAPLGVPPGYSVLQLIETSSITLHLNDAPLSSAYIDIFSCRNFDTECAISVVKQFFNPSSVSERFLIRAA